jgi:putative nucleotidyltransferase with HDIG domain
MITTAKVDINSFINKELPPLPAGVARVMSLLQDEDTSTRVIADTIGYDPGLTAKILQAANSPLYTSERTITSLPAAVNTLGEQTIYLMIMAFMAHNAFAKQIQHSKIGKAIWEHSLAVGLAAREISTTLNMRGTEELFTCGLLHDIGKLLFLRHNPDIYSEFEDSPCEIDGLRFEKEIYGFTHAQVGALAARRWGIPSEISYVIANHHNPSEAEQSIVTTRIIDAANEIANANGYGLRGKKDMSELLITESIIALRLSIEQIEKIWYKTQNDLEDIISSFK